MRLHRLALVVLVALLIAGCGAAPEVAAPTVGAGATAQPAATAAPTAQPAATPTEPPAPTAVPTQIPTDVPTTEPTAVPTETPVPKPAGAISKADLGEKWPFTVEQGEVRCLNAGEVVFIAEGTTYAVNGTAEGRKLYADIAPIWRDDPSYPGLKVSIGPIIDLGLKLCR